MRQAGRYLPEYRKVREKYSLLEICRAPEVATLVTLQPIERFELDAAILFSDLLVPLEPMGLDFSFVKGEGPSIHEPIRETSDIDRLEPVVPQESLSFTLEAIALLRQELPVPLIGFAGAPFTLASYAIEGGPSRNFEKTKSMMYEDPDGWHRLAKKLAVVVRDYLAAQIEAGAQAVQLFDSWAGSLSPEDYREFALPHSRFILQGLADFGVPRIHFGTAMGGLLRELRSAGADVVGVDWRIDLGRAWAEVGHDVAVQGNLDPLTLFAPPELVERRARSVLEQAAGRPGHVFNLGHGVLPGTSPDQVARLVDCVHREPSTP
jgi:uroporphyrinogen decarboxylase